ncbi:hypothetical protein HPP92_008516 [Vanilla planifolia]|uniref:Uncharacterized protein n=1 Tax=Vanilla planifolia TaxID=51239 RepID=A0A835RC41_VANPL|nr:hypothetical protein HPP92_008516 [Vanilla planifolia]
MAPCGETHASGGASSKGVHAGKKPQRPQQTQQADGLQRAMSDLSLQLNRGGLQRDAGKLPPISEVENANCECCGMSEECTPEYIRRVRARFCGRWICGLCSEAVKEEMQKKEGRRRRRFMRTWRYARGLISSGGRTRCCFKRRPCGIF